MATPERFLKMSPAAFNLTTRMRSRPAAILLLLAASTTACTHAITAQTAGRPSLTGPGFYPHWDLSTARVLGATELNLPSPPSGNAVITSVNQLRAMNSSEAAKQLPLKLKGVVTDLSGYHNSFFFQDATGGISVDRTDHAEVQLGDEVQITGTTGPGLFAPVVLASRVLVMGRAALPLAVPANFGDLLGGAQDSQWVQVEGIVHSSTVNQIDGHAVLVLHLEIGGGAVHVLLQDFSGIDGGRLVDAKLRLRGVCASDFNQKRQFVGLELYVPSPRFMEILEPAHPDPFDVSSIPIANVLQFGHAQHRVKVTGVSTVQLSSHSICIQQGGDGIKVQTLAKLSIPPGRKIEAVGFPAAGDYAPVLDDAVLRDLGPAAQVQPPLIHARDVITQEGDFYHTPDNQQFVRMVGTLLESHNQGARRVWLLRDGNEDFEASMPLPVNGRASQPANGSKIILMGICDVHADEDRNPLSFALLLGNAGDFTIVSRASWWTAAHTLVVLGLLASGFVLVMLWVGILRHRVEQQTRIIRESEERFRDLAQRDYLTGLPNRLMLDEHIARCFGESRADCRKAAVFTIDIDHFKKINDTYGHLIGDECLKIVAARLRGRVRTSDVIARTGGEEFTLVVGGLPDRETASRLSLALLDPFQQPVLLQGHRIELTVSVGGAIYPDDSEDPGVLSRLSDEALYLAKRSGRNRAVFATAEACSLAREKTATAATEEEAWHPAST